MSAVKYTIKPVWLFKHKTLMEFSEDLLNMHPKLHKP